MQYVLLLANKLPHRQVCTSGAWSEEGVIGKSCAFEAVQYFGPRPLEGVLANWCCWWHIGGEKRTPNQESGAKETSGRGERTLPQSKQLSRDRATWRCLGDCHCRSLNFTGEKKQKNTSGCVWKDSLWTIQSQLASFECSRLSFCSV